MKDIPWEKTADGVHAHLKESTGRFMIPVLLLLNTADRKMKEPELISADFQGEAVLFERRLGIFLRRGTATEYLGAYVPDEREDEDSTHQGRSIPLPALCIRHAYWESTRDSQHFREAASMRQYVLGNAQIDSHILFLSTAMAQKIVLLLEEAEHMVQQGIGLRPASRDKPLWDSLEFELLNGGLHASLFYGLGTSENSVLEAWVTQWQQSFSMIDTASSVIPDHGCFLSYPGSLMEILEKFPDESFVQWNTRFEQKRRSSSSL